MKFRAVVLVVIASAIGGLGILILLDRALGFSLEWGPIGTWFSGCISTVAVLVAIWVALDNQKERIREQTDERERAEGRALRRAKRVRLRTEWRIDKNRWILFIENGDDRPIYEVDWQSGVAVAADFSSFRTLFGESLETQRVVKPGASGERSVFASNFGNSEVPEVSGQTHFYLPAVTFEDDEGYVFCWDNSPSSLLMGHGGRVAGEWRLKGDDRNGYPADQPIVSALYEAATLPLLEQAQIIKKVRSLSR